jgi:hypothetical protein
MPGPDPRLAPGCRSRWRRMAPVGAQDGVAPRDQSAGGSAARAPVVVDEVEEGDALAAVEIGPPAHLGWRAPRRTAAASVGDLRSMLHIFHPEAGRNDFEQPCIVRSPRMLLSAVRTMCAADHVRQPLKGGFVGIDAGGETGTVVGRRNINTPMGPPRYSASSMNRRRASGARSKSMPFCGGRGSWLPPRPCARPNPTDSSPTNASKVTSNSTQPATVNTMPMPLKSLTRWRGAGSACLNFFRTPVDSAVPRSSCDRTSPTKEKDQCVSPERAW